MISEYFEHQEGSTKPLRDNERIQDEGQLESTTTVFPSSPAGNSTHDFTYMPFTFVEQVVKSLSEIELDESKMNWSSPFLIELLQTNADQQAEDTIQFQANDPIIFEDRPVMGLE